MVKLQNGSYRPASSMREDTKGRPNMSRSSHFSTKITPGMAIREEDYSPSSTSESKKKERGSSFNRQNKGKKMPTAVAPIIPQQRAPVSRSQENAGFCHLSFTKGTQSRRMHRCSFTSKSHAPTTAQEQKWYSYLQEKMVIAL